MWNGIHLLTMHSVTTTAGISVHYDVERDSLAYLTCSLTLGVGGPFPIRSVPLLVRLSPRPPLYVYLPASTSVSLGLCLSASVSASLPLSLSMVPCSLFETVCADPLERRALT
jgi:hypothetical protein